MFNILIVPAIYYKYVDVIKTGSVEVRGLQLEEVPLRNKGQKDPNLEFYSFQPYVSDTVNKELISVEYLPYHTVIA